MNPSWPMNFPHVTGLLRRCQWRGLSRAIQRVSSFQFTFLWVSHHLGRDCWTGLSPESHGSALRASTVVGATAQVLSQERMSGHSRKAERPAAPSPSTPLRRSPLKVKPQSEDGQQVISTALPSRGPNGCFSLDPCDSLKNCSWQWSEEQP